jgi:hypothetical protein
MLHRTDVSSPGHGPARGPVVVLMIVWGLTRVGLGHHLHAQSAGYQIPNAHTYTGLLLVFLLLRAFSSGCTALTGVEAISNGVKIERFAS